MRLINEIILNNICKNRMFKWKEDSHCKGEAYCKLTNEECKYQCSEERPTGEWILNALVTEGQCSRCEARARLVFGVNYCPSCGAKMKVRKEE